MPCVRVDDLTDEQVRKLRIVDNKANESPWDFDLLEQELENLDMDDFDFDFLIATDMSDEKLNDLFVDDETEPKEPKKIQCPHCGEWFEI